VAPPLLRPTVSAPVPAFGLTGAVVHSVSDAPDAADWALVDRWDDIEGCGAGGGRSVGAIGQIPPVVDPGSIPTAVYVHDMNTRTRTCT
jgi:hypothetical protein